MKKVILALSCVVFLLFSGIAFSADSGPYISVQGGVALLRDSDLSSNSGSAQAEFETGFAVGVAAGYKFNQWFRAELEFGYQKSDLDTLGAGGVRIGANGDATIYSGLANGYIDFKNNTPLTPYLTAGAGYAQVKANDWSILGINIGSDDDNVFCYQVGAGVGFAVTNNLTIDLKYRYFATEDPEFSGIKGEVASHNVYLGLRYAF